jgi:putative restriction endonuclease
MAWEVYGSANGVVSFGSFRERLLRFRSRFDMETDPKQDFWIGCVLVNQPIFFADGDLVRMPDDWASNIVQGKGYDLTTGEGHRIWMECRGRAGRVRYEPAATPEPLLIGEPTPFGGPSIIHPRLGQRSFRVAVLDSYGRRCAVTSERTLPALEAAHIREYHDLPSHSITNGILFRADIHKLFDAGYVTVTPEHRFEVSRRIKEEFENGKQHSALHGTEIRLPENPPNRPAAEALWWHNEEWYLG